MKKVSRYAILSGIMGIIAINWHRNTFISNALRIFGIIVGVGLLLIGIFPLGFAIFISMDALRIPAAPMREFPQTMANNILHLIFFIGSFTGILTLPFWTLLLGKALLKQKNIPA